MIVLALQLNPPENWRLSQQKERERREGGIRESEGEGERGRRERERGIEKGGRERERDYVLPGTSC